MGLTSVLREAWRRLGGLLKILGLPPGRNIGGFGLLPDRWCGASAAFCRGVRKRLHGSDFASESGIVRMCRTREIQTRFRRLGRMKPSSGAIRSSCGSDGPARMRIGPTTIASFARPASAIIGTAILTTGPVPLRVDTTGSRIMRYAKTEPMLGCVERASSVWVVLSAGRDARRGNPDRAISVLPGCRDSAKIGKFSCPGDICI